MIAQRSLLFRTFRCHNGMDKETSTCFHTCAPAKCSRVQDSLSFYLLRWSESMPPDCNIEAGREPPSSSTSFNNVTPASTPECSEWSFGHRVHTPFCTPLLLVRKWSHVCHLNFFFGKKDEVHSCLSLGITCWHSVSPDLSPCQGPHAAVL